MAELTVGSLFSGIGGLDLGLERAGMRVIWQSEIDPYACKVLSKHWPEVVNHGNIKEINWKEVERPDVICGGYPCQPFSTAGKRRGEEDPRHLWPWVREAISQLRPRYAILENVRGHLSMGGLSVVGELASIGYDAEWRVVSAASVGANHRRDRVIIVAYPNNSRNRAPGRNIDGNGTALEQGRQLIAQPWSCRCCTNVADAHGGRCQQCEPKIKPFQRLSGSSKRDISNTDITRSQRWNSASSSQWQGSDGHSWPGSWWETEPDVGRVANGVPARVDRLRGLGNAVVPQVAEVIGRMVVAHAG